MNALMTLKGMILRIMALSLFTGCAVFAHQGNGMEKETVVEGESFSRVAVSSGAKVVLVPGETSRAVIRLDSNLTEFLKADVSEGTLRVGFGDEWVCPTVYRVEVTAPFLERISLSGGCRASGQFRTGRELDIECSGGSVLRAGFGEDAAVSEISVRCVADDSDSAFEVRPVLDLDLSGGSIAELDGDMANLVVNGSGGSIADLRGSAEDMKLNLSGGSIALLDALPCRDVRYSLSGGSQAEIRAAGTVRGDLSGGSVIRRR